MSSNTEYLEALLRNNQSIIFDAFQQSSGSRLDSSNRDPIKNVFQGGNNNFDYQVDYFDDYGSASESVNQENIKAAGTLYYIMVLADQLGILKVADQVLLSWTSGSLDIPLGETATRLYNFFQLKNFRISADERKTFYKMGFNLGDGQTVDQMAINTQFAPLWDGLMNECVRYIEKTEKSDNPGLVSKSGINQAIIALRHNLSRSTAGIVKAMIPEMYAHLQDAYTILNAESVVSQLGQGLHKDAWNVIERISMDKFNYLPPVSSYRQIAVTAHKIITAIAEYSETTFSENDFSELVYNVESHIIAQSQISGDPGIQGQDEEDIEDAEFETMEEEWDF